MNVKEISEQIRNFRGVTRKNGIKDLDSILPQNNFPHVIAAEGEDASVIDCGLDEYILLAADGIMESMLKKDQYLAGYFQILVNVNDIAAMGGRQKAMVDIFSIYDNKIKSEVLRGMREGIERFEVPIVGGHTHPDTSYNSIDISIMGTVRKDAIIRSNTARQGDDLVMVADLEGHYPWEGSFAWETTLSRSKEIIRQQIEAAAIVGEKHLVSQGKDISNPGTIGTIGMMLESSGKGATINLDSILVPEKCKDFTHWLLSYLGSGFVYSCDPKNSKEVIKIFSEAGCEGQVIGKIDDSPLLKISSENQTETVFDFSKEIITGHNPRLKK